MSNQNLSLLDDLVGTQYNDLRGVVAIDGHSNITELYNLCAENGISRDDYFLIGVGFSEFNIDGIGSRGFVNCTVLLLDKATYADTFDEIKSQLLQKSRVNVIKKSFNVDYSDLRRYIKRVDMMLMTDMGNYISEMEIVDNE